MSEPFLAEIRIVGFNFAPRGWAFCDGQLLPINQNQSLWSLVGNLYGGDGRTTFALPDLRGRVPVHPDREGIREGSKGGMEGVALEPPNLPAHSHALRGTAAEADSGDPVGRLPGGADAQIYDQPGALVETAVEAVAATGGGQMHGNMQPFLALNFVIALQGLFPSRN
jgi:microcystin-dependent protein